MSQLELYLNLQNIKNRNIKMYVQKTKTFIYLRAIFRFLFLPNLQRLNFNYNSISILIITTQQPTN